MPPLLALFAFVNLVIGSAAFGPSGVLGAVAEGLGTTPAAAGQAMTVYALATALIAPLVMMATGRWPRRRALLLALALFTAGNLLCALAPTLPVFLLGRAVMGVGAVFTPLAAGIAIALVAPEQRGKALAFVFLGMSLSYVVGVPLSSWVGLGYGFRAALWGATGASALAFVALALAVPRDVQAPGASFAGLGQVLRRADVAAALAMTLAYFTAIFMVFSYIGPVLTGLVPMSAGELSGTLALFGVAGMAGTLLGGLANDRFGPRRTLLAQLSLLVAMMLALPFTAGHWPWMMAVLLLWGAAGFGMMAPQQGRIAGMAPQQAPLLLSLNTSMLYFGTAAGAAVGGAVSRALPFAQMSWAGVFAVLLALGLLLLGPVRAPSVAGPLPETLR